MERLPSRRTDRAPPPGNRRPSLNVLDRDGASIVQIDHEDPAEGLRLLAEAFGVSSIDTIAGLLEQITFACGRERQVDELDLNFAASTVAGIAPRDEVEALLATQMTAVHAEVMRQLAMLRRASTLEEMEVYERATNRLARTFAAQSEALRRGRTRPIQKIEVRHVHVSEGGRAIIGSVEHGRGR